MTTWQAFCIPCCMVDPRILKIVVRNLPKTKNQRWKPERRNLSQSTIRAIEQSKPTPPPNRERFL